MIRFKKMKGKVSRTETHLSCSTPYRAVLSQMFWFWWLWREQSDNCVQSATVWTPAGVPFNSRFRDQNFSFESFAYFHTVNGLTGDSFKPATGHPVRRVGSTLLPSWGKNVNGLVNRQ